MNEQTIVCPADGGGQRIDVFLAAHCPTLSRSRLQALLKSGDVTLDGETVKPNRLLAGGETIRLRIPEAVEQDVEPQALPLDVVYEDHDVIVINKPRGLVVHPAPGNRDHTLVNALLAHCDDLSGINGAIRPGIVHRIDKDTTGLLLVAKNDRAHLSLAAQIKEHSAARVYYAIVEGDVAEKGGRIDCPIGRHPVDRKKMAVTEKNSRDAVTEYRVLERFLKYTLVEVALETGRTHQIRVHMQYIGHPVLGDPLYGHGKKNPFGFVGQALHAGRISFCHPQSGERLTFEAPLPADMEAILTRLRKELEA